MASEEGIAKKLAEEFSPTFLSVRDESDGCGSKFMVVCVTAAFEGVGLLERQRSVNQCLAEEMKTVHALSMKTWTPAQFAKKGGAAAFDGASAQVNEEAGEAAAAAGGDDDA